MWIVISLYCYVCCNAERRGEPCPKHECWKNYNGAASTAEAVARIPCVNHATKSFTKQALKIKKKFNLNGILTLNRIRAMAEAACEHSCNR
mmetsp:Transcript_64026/g.151479  ORF Transcript_64026/g.151479 Transcript_64026/m.151479 type:complete len:91 (+) Transcript_64026:353-625(+)